MTKNTLHLLVMVFLFVLPTNSQSFQLEVEQEKLAHEIYKIGKTFKTADGVTIENTLTAISLRESSLGKFIVGDKKKNGDLKPLEEMSLGAFQIKIGTARDVIMKNDLFKYKYLLNDNLKLVNRLLTDPKFGAIITGYYFVNNYNEALKRNMWNPYFRAVSRHNGGWTNNKYYKVFLKDIDKIKKIDFEVKNF
ncbi:hypothetical protein DZA31_00425 [Arcobacter sp. HD9-500m-PIT-SAG02]|nr:hypothetical protein DZA31_00425 [Arcobacter sp. HD9-500m-PIT-SAG02]